MLSEAKHLAFSYCTRRSPLEHIVVLWGVHQGRSKIARVLLAGPESSLEDDFSAVFRNTKQATCPEIEAIADGLVAFLGGAAISFSLDRIRLDLCTPFQQQVLRAEHGIPRGQVSTYSLIAKHIGRPGAARAVGAALAANPFPLIIPCHRALRADRSLGGFQGGLAMKRALLAKEGLAFDGNERVTIESFWYA